MKILLAPDKFRGSLDAKQVCEAMKAGINLVSPNIEVVEMPMADGGEGTLDLLIWYAKGEKKVVEVNDPLGRKIEAPIGISADKQTAFIEMASASGLKLLSNQERNPLQTSTFGTGQLIRYALDLGIKSIILGIGGSATNDAGIGMATALGWQFLDKHQQELIPNGANLEKIDKIISPQKDYKDIQISVACDVTNPLYGENGAAYIYATQKGADKLMIEKLDRGLRNIAQVIERDFTENLAFDAGAGAAGGLGFGLKFFLNAELKQGVQLLMDFTNFEKQLADIDLIITGEGKIDQQSLQGKLITGITEKANQYNIPVAAIGGTLELSPKEWSKIGITYATSILNKPMDLEEALHYGFKGVENTTFALVNLFNFDKKDDILK